MRLIFSAITADKPEIIIMDEFFGLVMKLSKSESTSAKSDRCSINIGFCFAQHRVVEKPL